MRPCFVSLSLFLSYATVHSLRSHCILPVTRSPLHCSRLQYTIAIPLHSNYILYHTIIFISRQNAFPPDIMKASVIILGLSAMVFAQDSNNNNNTEDSIAASVAAQVCLLREQE